MAKSINFSSLPRFISQSKTNPVHNSMLYQNILTNSSLNSLSLPRKFLGCDFLEKNNGFARKIKVVDSLSGEGSLKETDDSPISIELVAVSSENQFDRVIAEAQQLEESVIIVWMATWCRKCIYLKPKLEKLAAEYYPRLRIYCVDVNNIPHKLVAYAGVTKMPTIQLWKDGKKQSEVIGGHKAHFVINDVRQMIENESTK